MPLRIWSNPAVLWSVVTLLFQVALFLDTGRNQRRLQAACDSALRQQRQRLKGEATGDGGRKKKAE